MKRMEEVYATKPGGNYVTETVKLLYWSPYDSFW